MTFLTDRFGTTSDNNSSSTTLLASGGDFTGTGENVENFGHVEVSVKSDKDSAVGGLQLQFSSDNTNWDIVESHTYTASNALNVNSNVKAKFFRVVYTNSTPDAQGTFRLQTIFTQTKLSGEVGFPKNAMGFMGRLTVGNPHNILDITHTRDLNDLQVIEDTAGGASAATHSTDTNTVTMVVSATGHIVTRQSRQYVIYQSGKVLNVICTGIINARSGGNETSTASRIGFFDDDDGLFFEYSGGVLNVVSRTSTSGSAVDTKVASTSWDNEIDIDTTTIQNFLIQITWSGTFNFGFIIGDIVYFVHQLTQANTASTIALKRANLPVRFELRATGASTNDGELDMIKATVFSDAGYNPPRRPFATYNRGLSLSVSDVITPVLSLRLKSSGTGSYPNANVFIRSISFESDDRNSVCSVYLFKDVDVTTSILTGETFASVDDESVLEVDTAATAVTITSGIELHSFGVTDTAISVMQFPTDKNNIQLNTNYDIGGSPLSDTLIFTILATSAANDVTLAVNWDEIF